jgi:hypothetical protein
MGKQLKEEDLFALDQKSGNQREVEQLEDVGIVNIMESKGLGDTIEKFTTATGIKKLADKILGGCGCNKRKEKLNEIFPYKK